MSILKGNFSFSAVAFSLFFAGAIELVCDQTIRRNPSSNDEGIELHIQSLALDANSQLHGTDNVYLRGTFNQNTKFEWGKAEHWALEPGKKQALDIHVKVPANWMQSDQLEFKLELVSGTGFENVLVRCAQISKQVTSYNRSYQCNVPGENTPLLTYRLGRKSDEVLSVASANPSGSAKAQ